MTTLFSEENQPQITTYHFFPSRAPGFGTKGQADGPCFLCYSLPPEPRWFYQFQLHIRAAVFHSHLLCPKPNRWRKRFNAQARCAHAQGCACTPFPSLLWVGSGFGVRVRGGFMSIPLHSTVLCSDHKCRTPETLLTKQAPLPFPVFTQSIQFFIAHYCFK